MSTRMRNMNERRDRILDAARSIIAENGFDALTTRGLAQVAGVSAPTLYNLIGGKDDIVRALAKAGAEHVQHRLSLLEFDSCLEWIEAIADEAVDMVESDETYHRALSFCQDRIAGGYGLRGDVGSHPALGEAAMTIALPACEAARAQGLLRGNVSTRDVTEQMFYAYLGPTREWAFGTISLAMSRYRIKRGFILALAADASDSFRHDLLDRLAALGRDAAERCAA
ncbi:TetR/AcrR family transcriptional regulator [Sphingopyxis sp.]|uniref:TetR/AcrR family transcriptional regulator n=1 Tax=Sphingopyxis sp. TaxID=1908224 RepID=UPI002FCBCEB0